MIAPLCFGNNTVQVLDVSYTTDKPPTATLQLNLKGDAKDTYSSLLTVRGGARVLPDQGIGTRLDIAGGDEPELVWSRKADWTTESGSGGSSYLEVIQDTKVYRSIAKKRPDLPQFLCTPAQFSDLMEFLVQTIFSRKELTKGYGKRKTNAFQDTLLQCMTDFYQKILARRFSGHPLFPQIEDQLGLTEDNPTQAATGSSEKGMKIVRD